MESQRNISVYISLEKLHSMNGLALEFSICIQQKDINHIFVPTLCYYQCLTWTLTKEKKQ